MAGSLYHHYHHYCAVHLFDAIVNITIIIIIIIIVAMFLICEMNS